MIEHLSSPQAARSWCNAQREQNNSIGFVPTMGALHAGHISLIERARAENTHVIASIFVNPLQFNNPDDLKKYPRDEAGDIAQLDGAGANAVFTGSVEQFLGEAQQLEPRDLKDPGRYARGMEGAHRPGHFAGVREIVGRLFDFVGPCRAYFGEKDYQQLQVIRELAAELQGIEIVPCPTARESSGLARSSRNLRLSARGKNDASVIFRAMQAANSEWLHGTRSPRVLQQAMLEVLQSSPLDLEYAELRDPKNWTTAQPEHDLDQARSFVACSIEGLRLIDNMALGTSR